MITVHRLVWDDWNIGHIARHEVIPKEAEEVCQGDYIVRASYQGRFVLIGPTSAGRMIAVVLEPLEYAGEYYPVTARPASRKERRLYQNQKGDETQ